MISFNCPKCGRSYNVTDDIIGNSFKCGQCGKTFRIPNPKEKDQEKKSDDTNSKDTVSPTTITFNQRPPIPESRRLIRIVLFADTIVACIIAGFITIIGIKAADSAIQEAAAAAMGSAIAIIPYCLARGYSFLCSELDSKVKEKGDKPKDITD